MVGPTTRTSEQDVGPDEEKVALLQRGEIPILEKGLVHALTLWDPAEAGYAMAELARRILDKEPIEAPLDLKAEGYAEVKFAEGSDKILEGAGWIVITKDNVDSFGF